MKLLLKVLLVVAVLGPGSLFGDDATETGPPIKIDSAFTNKFAELREAAGFIEQPAADGRNEWSPNLQLWMGVKAVEGKKQTIYFVQLTTLPTPQTNIWGEPWQPTLRTNNWSWQGTNKNAAPKRAEYVNPLYPVRARVFDADGRALKEGKTEMAWGMSTNGLLDLCRLSLELIPHEAPSDEPLANLPDSDNDRIMATVGGGFLWMMQMFGDLQTVPSVADVWKKAQVAIRMPAWTMIKGIITGFSINLQPCLADVTKIESAGENDATGLYRLPIELRSRRDKLSDVEIIIGSPRGAEMLLSGIRSIRAVHPTKPQREFLAQVLATGSCPEDK